MRTVRLRRSKDYPKTDARGVGGAAFYRGLEQGVSKGKSAK